MDKQAAKAAILSGETALDIEFGSTRIKAVLVDKQHTPLASGSFDWENRLEDGIWTYHYQEIWDWAPSLLCRSYKRRRTFVRRSLN